jgi:hypothetical protein
LIVQEAFDTVINVPATDIVDELVRLCAEKRR